MTTQYLELDRFIPYRLSVLSNLVSRAFAQLYAERFDLAIAEWRVLAVLGIAAPLSASEVCERTAMDKVRVSRAVQSLLASGLIERGISADDRRRASLTLTRRGEAINAENAGRLRLSKGALVLQGDESKPSPYGKNTLTRNTASMVETR